ncbi:hypothetical protein [Cesiribacter andamanensis]|uniref:Uncharacterized protein n=1 Tax=Cesiribacter andamanensis AMV16 TaxID=1279009 RepID=M7NNX1_9BACT|nr:hypothetical protein [Cesiribacter andamanensis]EMR03420.1 hypothetical protein ADICEAN_01442 [Cesiribacter andamanensis AMV16]
MKKILPLLLLLTGLGYTAAAQLTSQAYGQPLLVLTELDPGLRVPGSDVPSFALYDSGHIIYRQQQKGGVRYYQTQLAQEQLQELIGSLGISNELLELPQPPSPVSRRRPLRQTELYINLDTTVVKQVSGNLRQDERARKAAPPAFLRVYDKLVAYADEQALEWVPEKIEVLFTDALKPPRKTLKWPAHWPTLKSPDTIWRSEKLYSVYLDKAHYAEFLELMQQLDDSQAVEVNGKTFTVSYRLPFPNIVQTSAD